MADLTPKENSNFIFILRDSYWESSGRPGGRSNTPENGNVRFILIDCYSERSGRSSGRSPPSPSPRKWQLEIHTDRFLL